MRRLGQFNDQFAHGLYYPRALRQFLFFLRQWLNAEKLVLLIVRDPEKNMSLERVLGCRSHPPMGILPKSDSLAGILASHHNPIFIARNDQVAIQLKKSAYLKKLCPEFSATLLLPLPILGQNWGVCLLQSNEMPAYTKGFAAQLSLLTETVAIALRHSRLLYTLQRTSLEKDLLLEISRTINSTLNIDELLEMILDNLQQVVPYDKGSIFLLDPPGKRFARVARRGPKPLIDEMNFIRKTEGLCTWALQHRKPVLVADVSRDDRYFPMYLDTQSELDVPILHRDKVLGVFNLESNQKSAFTRKDRQMVQAFAGQTAVAIDNAWLYTELVEKKEMERELKIARQLQRALLPRRLPSAPGYQFAALNIPSRKVGGDLYDFIQFSPTRIGFAIGDVAGKGTPSALLMATLYSTYRGMVRLPMPVNQLIFELNNTLKDRMSDYTFITFFYGLLSTDTDELIYCNAGHCHPIVVHQDGRADYLDVGGTVLGFVQDTPYALGRYQLTPGDLLFLYTDGITEAMNPQEEFYGEKRVLDSLREMYNLPVKSILSKVFRTIKSYTNDHRLQDDFTAVAIALSAKDNSFII